MKTTAALLLVAVAIAGVGLYMNFNKKPATTMKKTDGGFSPESSRAPGNSNMVQNYEVNQRNIFAGGQFRNTPLPDATSQTFVQS